MISETVHVLLQLESDLLAPDKAQNQRMLITETLLGTNGYISYSQEKWLGLYLAAFKFLDLTLSLHGDRLPHFQMYRWAFEGGEGTCESAMTTKRSVIMVVMMVMIMMVITVVFSINTNGERLRRFDDILSSLSSEV